MIYWYSDLYMDEKVARQPKKCKKRVSARRPWKKSYVAITLASNEKNLFEIMETRQLFFRRYAYVDLYVVGLAANQKAAGELLQQMVQDMWKLDSSVRPHQYFVKEKFSGRIE